MIKKAKPAPKEKPVEPVSVPKVEEKPAEVQPKPDKEEDWEDVNDKPSTVPAQALPSAQPQPTGPAVNEEQVNTLVAISGKDLELCRAALQAA